MTTIGETSEAELKALGIVELGTIPPDGLPFLFRGNEPSGEDGEFDGPYHEIWLEIPAYNFANIKRYQREEEAGKGTLTPSTSNTIMAQLEYIVKMVARALRQNYRGVPTWLIEQTITPDNSFEISTKIAGLSGLVPKKEAPAEPAKKIPSPSTGTGSIAT
jgi:hypothetical protein